MKNGAVSCPLSKEILRFFETFHSTEVAFALGRGRPKGIGYILAKFARVRSELSAKRKGHAICMTLKLAIKQPELT